VREEILVDRRKFSVAEMVSAQFRGERFQVRRSEKGLGIAGPCVYHWLLRAINRPRVWRQLGLIVCGVVTAPGL